MITMMGEVENDRWDGMGPRTWDGKTTSRGRGRRTGGGVTKNYQRTPHHSSIVNVYCKGTNKPPGLKMLHLAAR